MGTMTKDASGNWSLDIPISAVGDVSQTLQTKGNYVDADIKINVKPQAGKASVPATTITANPSIGSTATSGKYPITVSTSQTITPTTATNGVIDSTTTHTGGTITVSGSATVDESTIGDPSTTVQTADKEISPDVQDRYVKISAGYKPTDRYLKITGMTGSSGEYSVDAGADKALKPVIANKASQSISGKTQITANITTSSSEVDTTYYMAIQSPANTDTLTATATVTQAGYLATGSKTDTATVGAAASDVTYISIVGGAENSTIANSTSEVSVGTASGGYYPLTNTMSSQIHTTTAGWIPAGDKTAESHTGVQVGKIAASTVSSNGTVTETPSVTISTTPTNIITTASSDYYFTVGATNNAGTVTPKHSATAGYTPTLTNVSGTDVTVTPTNSGTGVTYIQEGAIGGTVTDVSSGSASMTATSVQSASSGSHYITLNTSAGSAKAQASVTTEGYVPDSTSVVSEATSVPVSGSGTKFYLKDATTTQGTTTVSWATNKAGTYMTEPGGTTSAGSYASGDSITITEVKEGLDDVALWGKVADSKWIIMDDVNDTVVRGTESITEGYITAQTLAAATFKNAATSGKTYVDLSATDDAPVLVANDYLYIDKGYTDYVKISLSKLVPEGATAGISAGDILSGHSAYNSNGELITGTIPNLLSTDVTAAVSGTNYVITVPAQKYTTGSAITTVACAVYQGAYS